MSADRLAYLDTSAYLKLVVREPESAALRNELADWPARTSSTLLAVEAVRAARRIGDAAGDRAEAGLDTVALVPMDPAVLAAARRLDPRALRSLDAIHLATALSLGDDLGTVFSYDDRLNAAARAAGVEVRAPG